MPKITRRQSREAAFELLFEWSFTDDSIDEIMETAKASRDLKADAFAARLAHTVAENHKELDEVIELYSQGWKLRRISRTALAALRMSFCEMMNFDDIPVGASINEAVELVKKFGTNEEAAYINGILGNFERVRKGLAKAPAKPLQPENKQLYHEDVHTEQTECTEQKQQKLQRDKSDDIELLEDIIIEVD